MPKTFLKFNILLPALLMVGLFQQANKIKLESTVSGVNKPALLVRKADLNKDRDFEAVWNFPMTEKGELVM